MNSVQSFVFPQSRFLSSCAAAHRFLDVKAGALLRVHGPLAIMVLSYLFAACAGCTTAFLSGSSQDVPEKALQSRRAWRGTKAQNIS